MEWTELPPPVVLEASPPGPRKAAPLAARAPVFAVISIAFHGAAAVVLAAFPTAEPLALAPAPVDLAFEILPELEPPAELVPEPAVAPARPARVVAPRPAVAVPTPKVAPEPPAENVVPEAAPAVVAATVASTEGGLAVGMQAGAGSDGAAVGNRHADAPVGEAVASGAPIDRRALLRGYIREIDTVLRSAQRYPRAARLSGVQGTVVVGITVNPDGRVTRVRIRQSSGHEILDTAAVSGIEGLDRIPRPPEALGWETRELPYPVQYRL